MRKEELRNRILRKLGHPMVKVELTEDHLNDDIDLAIKRYARWATGSATQEVFFTVPVSAGQTLYDLPEGVVEVIAYEDSGKESGINTLFTVENYLYNQGTLNFSHMGGDFGLVSYHSALDFLDTLRRYTHTKYHWRYHDHINQLEITPPPETTGWALVKAYMMKGAVLNITQGPGSWVPEDTNEYLYDKEWVFKYALACAKVTLGTIRRKFSGFSSIGNTGIDLDGSDLISEGKEEMERLEEKLDLDESVEGWPIHIG
jgi:hypothetical protein